MPVGAVNDTDAVRAVRAAVAALNEGDVEGYLAAFSPSCLRRVSGTDVPRTLDDMRSDIAQLYGAFEPLYLHEDLLFGADRFVCARWRLVGVHTSAYFGIPASGNEISVQNCEVYEYDGSQVVAVWTYGDPLDLVGQLGVIPQLGQTS
jgi:predicted ester cyclase